MDLCETGGVWRNQTTVAKYVLLAYPDFDKCFDINTGASKYKLGAVIRQ